MHCQIRATPKLETAHQRDLNTCSPCLALGTVCQTSLFFSLVSSIALKMEQDSSHDALGVLLLVMLAVPPVIHSPPEPSTPNGSLQGCF